MNRRGECSFAHRLSDLLPPREVSQEYLGVWTDCVDRFYGQHMSDVQLERIMKYYKETHARDKPVWAYALKWFYAQDGLGTYPWFEWDFGIWQDLLSLQRGRIQDRMPFVWAWVMTTEGNVLSFPHALRLRREAMQGYVPLYRVAGPPGPPPRSSVESGQQGDGIQEESMAGIRTAVDAGSGLAYDAVLSPASSQEAVTSANNLVSAAQWLDVQLSMQESDAEEVSNDGMASTTWRTRWRRRRDEGVFIAADGRMVEPRIVAILGMASTTWRSRWRRRRDEGVFLVADGGDVEARIVAILDV